jgi:dTDP-glucose 4,6-dehydratase
VHNKIVARTILRCLKDEPFKIFPEADPPVRRWWMNVHDTCAAVDCLLASGEHNGAYNAVGNDRLTVSEAVKVILDQLGKQRLLEGYAEGRPLDEEEYFLDGSGLQQLGWAPKYDFESGIKDTVGWYRKNLDWITEGKA